MTKTTMTRRLLLQAAVLASALGGVAQAQDAAAVPPPPGGAKNVITVPCCKCVDGSKQEIPINTGATAQWQVTSTIPGLTGPWPMKPGVISNPHPAWGPVTAALAPARWLQPSTATTMQNFQNGPQTYTLRIFVPRCTIPMRVTVRGQVATDDAGSVWLNSAQIAGPTGFGPVPTPFTGTLNPGMNVLEVKVMNQGGGPTGMILRGSVVKECSNRLEAGGPRSEAAQD